jgi:hypothetical protein
MKTRQSRQAAQKIELKPGSHASLLYTEPGIPESALSFLAEGIEQGEKAAFLGWGRLNERVVSQMRDLHGINVRQRIADGQLILLEGSETTREIRADLQRVFAHSGKRSRGNGRLVTSLGWGEPGWPDESELLQLEARLNETCGELGIAALCLYDARQLSGSLVFEGSLGCHPTVFARCGCHKNPFFVTPSALQKELGARRRDEDRLRAWIS